METVKIKPIPHAFQPFEVSQQTAYFLNALRSFEKAKDDYFTALYEYYGEGRGNSIFEDDLPKLCAIQDRITAGLLQSIAEKVGENGNQI